VVVRADVTQWLVSGTVPHPILSFQIAAFLERFQWDGVDLKPSEGVTEWLGSTTASKKCLIFGMDSKLMYSIETKRDSYYHLEYLQYIIKTDKYSGQYQLNISSTDEDFKSFEWHLMHLQSLSGDEFGVNDLKPHIEILEYLKNNFKMKYALVDYFWILDHLLENEELMEEWGRAKRLYKRDDKIPPSEFMKTKSFKTGSIAYFLDSVMIDEIDKPEYGRGHQVFPFQVKLQALIDNLKKLRTLSTGFIDFQYIFFTFVDMHDPIILQVHYEPEKGLALRWYESSMIIDYWIERKGYISALNEKLSTTGKAPQGNMKPLIPSMLNFIEMGEIYDDLLKSIPD